MKKHEKIYIFTEELEQNIYTESKKVHSLLKISQIFFFLIFKFYNSQLANTLMFYLEVSHSFDNHLLKLF